MSPSDLQVEAIDYALAAYRDRGRWHIDELSDPTLESAQTLVAGLRRFPGEGGAIALISVDEDFFVLVRVDGADVRLLLSDVTAAQEWELAESVVDLLGLPQPDDEDDGPAGDLGLLADLGVSAVEMGVLLDDELYPDDVLSEVADQLGFGPEFDDAVGLEDD